LLLADLALCGRLCTFRILRAAGGADVKGHGFPYSPFRTISAIISRDQLPRQAQRFKDGSALERRALAFLATGATKTASAQNTFPGRPITVVVPAAAGGPTDTVARLVAESMSRTLGQTVVVENVGGAGGTIGMARVAKASPDGYTIAVWHIAQATAPALYDGL